MKKEVRDIIGEGSVDIHTISPE
ncbi:hypothetical protein LCGC14_2468020, partial [marine sediment metagenome]